MLSIWFMKYRFNEKNEHLSFPLLFSNWEMGKTNFVALSVLFQISIFVFFEFGILQIPQRSCVLRIILFIQSINITLGRDHYRC